LPKKPVTKPVFNLSFSINLWGCSSPDKIYHSKNQLEICSGKAIWNKLKNLAQEEVFSQTQESRSLTLGKRRRAV
jgi:hypothetical protein